MTDITIPPQAVEAAAEADYLETFSNAVYSWAEAPTWLKDNCRRRATAALRAGLAAWPGIWESDGRLNRVTTQPHLLLPLPRKARDE